MKMQKLQFVKQFEVHFAQYQLNNGNGHMIKLNVDYKNNTFKLTPSVQLSTEFEKEVQQIAKGLLTRKHGVNLAEREQYI